ncbi:MAG: hydrolase, partial [Gemmatimonadota bacterium]|nr:hydrolase [Gemmatimonadota bacterium]
EIAAGFNPELGFLQRAAYRSFNGLLFHRFRPDALGFHELRPHASYNGFWGMDGFYESGLLHVDNHWEWANGYEIHTGINFTHEGVRQPFDIVDQVAVAAGSYDHVEAQLVGMTDQRKWISLSVRAVIGGFFGGDRVALSPSLTVRAGEAFNSEIGLSRNDVDLPGGSFVTNLLRARLSYSFTPRLYVQALLQLNDAADVWSANLRFGWLQTAGTGLFLVYNQTNGFADALIPGVDNQTLIVKYSHLINVLK